MTEWLHHYLPPGLKSMFLNFKKLLVFSLWDKEYKNFPKLHLFRIFQSTANVQWKKETTTIAVSFTSKKNEDKDKVISHRQKIINNTNCNDLSDEEMFSPTFLYI